MEQQLSIGQESGSGSGGMQTGGSPMRRQGSLRKVLHPSDASDSMMGVPAKILERPQPKNLTGLCYYNFFQEYNLMLEYNLLRRHLHPGLFVIPSSASKSLWFGVIFVNSGPYKDGIFRFTLHISKAFPHTKCPRVVFESSVFHPCIDEETMELNLLSVFPNWSKETNRIWQVLDYVHTIFHSSDWAPPPSNQCAANMYIKDRENFMKLAKQSVDMSLNSIFDEPVNQDPHYFRFNTYNERIHFNARQALSTPEEEEDRGCGVRKGYSWIEPGSVCAFSKPLL